MTLKNEFMKGLRLQIGDGSSIKFWLDNWALDEPLVQYAMPNICCDDHSLVKHYINQDSTWKET